MDIQRIWFEQPPGTPYRELHWKDQYGEWFLPQGFVPASNLTRGAVAWPSVGDQGVHPEVTRCLVVSNNQLPEDDPNNYYTSYEGISDPVFVELIRRLESRDYNDVPAGQD